MMVAIWMVTYNHSLNIEQAVESIMMQTTNFAYKLYIGEDCSTDNTRQICEFLQSKYPDKIDLIAHEKNIGPTKNARSIYEKVFNSGAKYIAMCEGDDYWTDSNKLQMQVDFLEKNTDYNIVWTKFNKVNEFGNLIEKDLPIFDESLSEVSVENLLTEYRTMTLTCVFRRKVLNHVNLNMFKFIKDNTIYYLALLHSKGKVLNINTACYRIHDGGVWSTKPRFRNSLNNYYNFLEIKNKIVSNSPLKQFLKSNLREIVYSLVGKENCKKVSIRDFIEIFFLVMVKCSFIDKLRYLKWFFIKLIQSK